MLLLIVGLVFGALICSRHLRLAKADDAHKAVRAWVDGKPVESYVKE